MKRIFATSLMALSMMLYGCATGAPQASETQQQDITDTPAVSDSAADEGSIGSTPESSGTANTSTPAVSDSAVDEDSFGPMPEFSSQDIYGNAIDSSILADSKLTMVNYWATWCGPCVAEMPELAELAKSMPEGSQLIGVCFDGSTEKNEAIEIAEGSAVEYPNIIPDKALDEYGAQMMYIPTTVFYDSQGNQVGEAVVGAMSGEAYREEIEARLELL